MKVDVNMPNILKLIFPRLYVKTNFKAYIFMMINLSFRLHLAVILLRDKLHTFPEMHKIGNINELFLIREIYLSLYIFIYNEF